MSHQEVEGEIRSVVSLQNETAVDWCVDGSFSINFRITMYYQIWSYLVVPDKSLFLGKKIICRPRINVGFNLLLYSNHCDLASETSYAFHIFHALLGLKR